MENRVSKLHVLALREIVADIGADRGILLSESAFQSGAVEAANLTNIQLASLGIIRDSAKDQIYSMRLRELYDNVLDLKERYWALPKSLRIETGLRPDRGGYGYSANVVLDIADKLLSRAIRGVFPIEVDPFDQHSIRDLPREIISQEEAIQAIAPHALHAEDLIRKAEGVK